MQLKFASLVLFSILVAASPTPPLRTIPLTRRAFTQNGIADMNGLKANLEYAKAKISKGFANYETNMGTRHPNDNGALRKHLEKRKTGEVLLTNDLNGTLWHGPIDIGTPAGTFTVLFDTGSSSLFVPGKACTDENCAGHKIYDTSASSTAVDQHRNFSIKFSDKSTVFGDVFSDTVSLAGLTATNQTVVAVSQYSSLFAVDVYPPDGLMGMAFPSISCPSCLSAFQSLIDQGQTTRPVFGFTHLDDGGELFLGGTDTSAFTGDLTFTPLTTKSAYWQISAERASVGDTVAIKEPHEAIVDTGTTLVYLDSTSANAIYAAIPGSANVSDIQGVFTVPCDSVPNDISFTFGGKAFIISADTFNLGRLSNESTDCVGGIFASDDFGAWILGDVFLRNVYAEFDVGNLQVGFAPVVC